MIYKKFRQWHIVAVLATLSAVLFQLISSFKYPINLTIQDKGFLSIIGYGKMHVEDNIFMPSNKIEVVSSTPFLPNSIPQTKYTTSQFVRGNSDAGYCPGHYNFDDTKLLELHDVVFTTECVIIQKNGYHLFKRACHPRYWGIGQPYHTPDFEYPIFQKAICVGHQHTSDWGHWSLEALPAIIALPEEILYTSVIVVPVLNDFVVENLREFGVDPAQIYASLNGRVGAKVLYTVNSLWCGDLNRKLLLNMRRIVAEKYDLDKINPTRYIITNRKKNYSRYFGNFEELFAKCKEEFPTIPWQRFQYFDTFSEQVKYFNSIKFIFAIHGSMLTNILYMQEDTIVVELQLENWLLSFINIAQMTGKIHISGRDTTIDFRSHEPQTANIPYCIKLIKAGLQKTPFLPDGTKIQ
ncbi:hypothetical protein TVAG_110490 [Trichomonas vaginalis G3]|uniref:Glycosyltransferase 61 catalytic domain-containing protein n=1 Tax=Trichomonas vaginalis (strain ATCC PRA-98 / G3) TaxID=412133 RepID=A2DGQ0_TRIV3|nr:protein of unknown function, DUF563 family [Trichomonas vaginalis G3]EAY20437.1 hypothetical protein TVAG_110490 [Trichomonas vaginalis G3]KAI5490513.1 protein of unknown function, DUF563 family [Trichomonas vaginalis G3]|eukprot:XP_001581423.1 hypothetical protein [Trichomonas vaginalis G3]